MSFDISVLKNEEKIGFALRSLYARYGYSGFKMSRFEEYDLYARNKDFLVSDRIITFTDADGRLMALKPDVTLSIVKSVKDAPEAVSKVYYNENVYRLSPRTRSFKEIPQAGLECIGSISLETLREVLLLAALSLKEISPKSVLDISHLGLIQAVMNSLSIDAETSAELFPYIRSKNLQGLAECCAANGLSGEAAAILGRFISVSGSVKQALPGLNAFNICPEAEAAVSELKEILSGLDDDITDIMNIDFSVSGDMKYYNGIAFTGFIEGVPETVLSGGRYDNLLKKMGRSSSAVGFAVYLDTLEQFDICGKEGL